MKAFYITLACSALLAGCGGSGGSLNGDQTSSGTESGLQLTSSNAATAAKVTFASMLGSTDLIEVGDSLGISANAPGVKAKASLAPQTSGFLVNVLQKVPFGPEVHVCLVSGSIKISGELADPFTLSSGDSFTIEADACDDGGGEILDGLMSLTVSEFTGDIFTGLYQIAMQADLDAFQVTTANDVISNSGDASILLDTRSAPLVIASVSGQSMTTTTNSSTETLTNYSADQSVDANFDPPPFVLDAQGTLDSSLLSGEISYSTPVSFEGLGLDYPTSGELLIVGDKSNVRMVAVDNVNVRIEIDSNDDGNIDETINTTWAELTS
jgi:hypothetical protein